MKIETIPLNCTALTLAQWNTKKQEHEREVHELLREYFEDRGKGKKHPVVDFLFEYYRFPPSKLMHWHPGFQVALECAFDEYNFRKEYRRNGSVIKADISFFPQKRLSYARYILKLLKSTDARKPSFACFGMHEWAMVYKTGNTRHQHTPLRLSAEKIQALVESRPLLCTHFDAFRFYTQPAKPLNKFSLSREKCIENEQPGCIHTNMDVYKWAYKFFPWIGSDLILEAFKCALEARIVDMRASPYDLSKYGLTPIPVETETGRVVYKEKQEEIYRKAAPVRKKLIQVYKALILAVEKSGDSP